MSALYQEFNQYLKSCFEEEKVLKETAQGRVVRLRHRQSHRLYVCHAFPGQSDAVRKLIGVGCRHMPRILEAADENGQVLLLEEYIPGDNLGMLCLGHTMKPGQVRHITADLCDALHVLHARGLVHRDVKPENVILDEKRAVLIDFNALRQGDPPLLAGQPKSPGQDTRILGTMGYAPPEQYGLSRTDATADIYALGVLINVLLTGVHPSVKLPSGRWGRIVSRCTMTNPEQRYPSAQAVWQAL